MINRYHISHALSHVLKTLPQDPGLCSNFLCPFTSRSRLFALTTDLPGPADGPLNIVQGNILASWSQNQNPFRMSEGDKSDGNLGVLPIWALDDTRYSSRIAISWCSCLATSRWWWIHNRSSISYLTNTLCQLLKTLLKNAGLFSKCPCLFTSRSRLFVFVPMARALSLLCEVGRMFWRCRGTLHHTGRGWPAQLTVRRNTNCFYLKMNRPVPQQHCNSVPLQQEWKNPTDSETWVSCANLNCTEIRVLKRVGKWVAVDFKLHLVAEAVSQTLAMSLVPFSQSLPRGPAKLRPQAWSVAGSKCNGPFPNNPRDGRSKADSLLPRLCKKI